MSNTALFKEALAAGEGVVRLAPCWVPRSFLMPGGRLKLDPRDPLEVRKVPIRMPLFHMRLVWGQQAIDEPAQQWLRAEIVRCFSNRN